MIEGPLAGLLVLDLGQYIAAPFCAKLLGDYGARVIKVEPPTGDPVRRFPPLTQGAGESALFLYLNTNKQGVTLDLENKQDKAVLRRLAARADVLVEGYPPGYLARIGLDYDHLASDNPALVMLSITPFGQTGPYASYKGPDIAMYAMSQWMNHLGEPGREPLKAGGWQAQYVAGLYGTVAVMTALSYRARGGEGQHIDLSNLEAAICVQSYPTTQYQWSGQIRARQGNMFSVMPCKDGFIGVNIAIAGEWERLCGMLAMPELLGDPRFKDRPSRTQHSQELAKRIGPWLRERTQEDLYREAQHWRIAFAKVCTPQQLLEDPQFAFREYFVEAEHPQAGRLQYPGPPVKMAEGSWALRSTAPVLGQDTEAVLQELGLRRDEIAELRRRKVI